MCSTLISINFFLDVHISPGVCDLKYNFNRVLDCTHAKPQRIRHCYVCLGKHSSHGHRKNPLLKELLQESVKTYIPANFLWVKCEISSRHDQDFRKRNNHFLRVPTISQRHPNVGKNVRRCSDEMVSSPSNPNANWNTEILACCDKVRTQSQHKSAYLGEI